VPLVFLLTLTNRPESMGLVCASIYILLLILFIPFAFSPVSLSTTEPQYTVREGIVVNEFPHYQVRVSYIPITLAYKLMRIKLSVYLSSILSLLIATMLGFLDDVFDIRWRHKVPIPIIASIPLLMVYYADNGNTHIVVPIPFRPFFGSLLNLGTPSLTFFRFCYQWMRIIGPLYYLYMSLLSTFSTNSINILAGINGSEVSQAVVIAVSVILNDLLYLPWPTGFRVPLHLLGSHAEVEVGGVWNAGMAYGSTQLVERHLFSLYFMLPLLGVCLGFLFHNWCANFLSVCGRTLILTHRTRRYPSRAFPGDTLCYVTGMAFAVVGIQAHFSKTLLLFFLPQIFNFILSCPQLFGLVPCPRHRVPRYELTYQL
jgi:UDP-N-acetylglucosamine--dolichyl-phosphate N-acetylglucosaminephosphotransferase